MAKRRGRDNRKFERKPQMSALAGGGAREGGMSPRELNRTLKKAQDLGNAGKWEEALPHLVKAWDEMPEDINLLTVLCQALVAVGVRDKALEVLERTLKVHEPTAEIIGVIQMLAREMDMQDVSLKLAHQLVQMEPREPRHYVNLATAYSAKMQYDESIEMLQQVIPMFPDFGDLWNVLATQVRARDGVDASLVFFQEALRLNPKDFKVYSNYAQSLFIQGDYERARDANEMSIKLNADNPEPKTGLAQVQFYFGEFDKAWENYKARLNTRRSIKQVQIYTHGITEWQGEPLEGKTLLVEPEQGIGDEIMWGNYIRFLYERADKLFIGCDRRLVSMYQRAFPNAHVERFYDRIHQGYRFRSLPVMQKMMREDGLTVDYAIPVAQSPSFEWRDVESIKPHPDGFLAPDQELADKFQARLAAISSKPKVGLAWRSGVLDPHRKHYYSSVEDLGPLMKYADKIDFINLQYGEVTNELAEVKSTFGVTVHQFDDVDLKADIEANLAIMDACDYVVSPASAPAQFAMAVGAPTLIMSLPRLWWAFGGTDRVLFAKDGELIIGGDNPSWDDVITRVAQRLGERLGL